MVKSLEVILSDYTFNSLNKYLSNRKNRKHDHYIFIRNLFNYITLIKKSDDIWKKLNVKFYEQLIFAYEELKLYPYKFVEQIELLWLVPEIDMINLYLDARFIWVKDILYWVGNIINHRLAVKLWYKWRDDVDAFLGYVSIVDENVKLSNYEQMLFTYPWIKSVKHIVDILMQISEAWTFRLWFDTKCPKKLCNALSSYIDIAIFFQLLRRWVNYSQDFLNNENKMNKIYTISEFMAYDIIFTSLSIDLENLDNVFITNYKTFLSFILRQFSKSYTNYYHLSYFYDILVDNVGVNVKRDKLKITGPWDMQNMLKLAGADDEFYDILIRSIYKVYFMNIPLLEEEWFYWDYEKRFNLGQFAIWNKAINALNDMDFGTAQMCFQEIQEFEDFFRYKYNIYSIDFNVFYLIAKSMDQFAGNQVSKSKLSYKKKWLSKSNSNSYSESSDRQSNIIKLLNIMESVYDEWKSMIIDEYPKLEINSKLDLLKIEENKIDEIRALLK